MNFASRADAAMTSERQMRILQMIGTFDASGAETVVLNLSNELRRRGHWVSVCSRTGGPLVPRLEDVEYFALPKARAIDGSYLSRLISLVRRLDVDLIHSHLFGNDVYGFLAARLTGRGHVCTIHGADSLRSWKRVTTYRAMAPLTDHVVAVSEMLQTRFVEECWAHRQKVSLVRNGIDVDMPPPDIGQLQQLRRTLGLADTGPIVGAVGNVKRVKAYEVLLQAFALLQRKYPDATLLIAGSTDEDPEYTSEVIRLRDSLNLSGAVHLLGSRPDVRQILSLLDVYVISSRFEGTSLALLEAMASGRPVVATAVGGNPLVVTHEKSGLVIAPGEPEALSAAVDSLLSNREMAARLGMAARGSVRERYGLAQMVNGYTKVYEEVLGAHRRHRTHAR